METTETQTIEEFRPAPNGSSSGAPVMLTREAILAAEDLQTELVNVPEWGGAVFVRALNGRDRAEWQEASLIQRGKNSSLNFQLSTVTLVALAIVNDRGERMFSRNDITQLRMKSSAALERVAEVAMRLSGIGDDEMAEISGNSEANLSGDSPTDSLSG